VYLSESSSVGGASGLWVAYWSQHAYNWQLVINGVVTINNAHGSEAIAFRGNNSAVTVDGNLDMFGIHTGSIVYCTAKPCP
jgi:hypothetical protein